MGTNFRWTATVVAVAALAGCGVHAGLSLPAKIADAQTPVYDTLTTGRPTETAVTAPFQSAPTDAPTTTAAPVQVGSALTLTPTETSFLSDVRALPGAPNLSDDVLLKTASATCDLYLLGGSVSDIVRIIAGSGLPYTSNLFMVEVAKLATAAFCLPLNDFMAS